MNSIIAIRNELAELRAQQAKLEKALAILDPEAIAQAAASAPIKTTPAKGTPGRKRADGGPTARERITKYLTEHPEGVMQSEFYSLGVDTAQVAGLMKKMEERGEIIRTTIMEGSRPRRHVKLLSNSTVDAAP